MIDLLPAADIAKHLDSHESTIRREFVRNRGGRGYRPKQAQVLADVRSLNVIDDFNRELLCTEIGCSLPSVRLTRALDQVIEWRGRPASIRSKTRTSSVLTGRCAMSCSAPCLFGNIEGAYAYNHDWPSMALNGRTPIQCLQAYLDSNH